VERAHGRQPIMAQSVITDLRAKAGQHVLVKWSATGPKPAGAEANLLRNARTFQRQLIATVSHELRRPSRESRASAETLRAAGLERQENRDPLMDIIERTPTAGGLVEDLPDIAELETAEPSPAHGLR